MRIRRRNTVGKGARRCNRQHKGHQNAGACNRPLEQSKEQDGINTHVHAGGGGGSSNNDSSNRSPTSKQ